jgi:hypothetical protein
MSGASGAARDEPGSRFFRQTSFSSGFVKEEFVDSAPQPERLAPLSWFSDLLSVVVDSFSFAFFCLSFSSLTHLLGSWWNRFLAEE